MLQAGGAALLAAAALAGPHRPGHSPATVAPATRQIRQEIVDRQPSLIDAAVARIAAGSAPGAQVYFLGFAGFGDERVFAEEIALAEQRVAERYDAGARSLRLVNDRRDLETYPFATVASLRYALDALGRVMDEDDVLFLALSSHGSEDATIAISNPGMRSDDLERRRAGGCPRTCRHPLARDRHLGLLFGKFHRHAGRQSHHRAQRRRAGPRVIRLLG